VFNNKRITRYIGDGYLRRIEIKYLNFGKKKKRKYVAGRGLTRTYPASAYKINTRCRQYIIVFLLRVYLLFIYDFPSSFSARSHIILSAVFARLYQISRNGKAGRQFYEEHQSASRVVGPVRLFSESSAGARRVLFYNDEVCCFFKHRNDSCPLNTTV